jgi:hypothetical protein
VLDAVSPPLSLQPLPYGTRLRLRYADINPIHRLPTHPPITHRLFPRFYPVGGRY